MPTLLQNSVWGVAANSNHTSAGVKLWSESTALYTGHRGRGGRLLLQKEEVPSPSWIMSMTSKVPALRTATLEEIAKTIAVPHDHRPLRLPTFPNLERTSVMQFTANGTAVTTASAATALLVRSSTYPVWFNSPVDTDVGGVLRQLTLAQANVANGGTIYLADVFESPWVTSTFLGRPYPLGMSRGKTWLYYCAGCLGGVRLTANAAAAPVTLNLDIELYTADGTQATNIAASMAAGATSCEFILPDVAVSYFWRPVSVTISLGGLSNVTLFGGLATNGTLGAPIPGGPSTLLLPLLAPPEFGVTSLPYEDNRVTAAAVLFTNVTRVLDKEGTVLAARFASRTAAVDMFSITASQIAGVHPSERYFGPLEKGVYAYTLPDAASEIFRPALVSWFGQAKVPVFDMDRIEYFTAIVFSDLDSTLQTTMAWTIDWHLEFRSQSVLFPRGYSSYPLETYHASQMALARMGTIFENPIHLATIANMARTAAKAVWPIIKPYAVQGASYLLNKAGQALLPSKPQPVKMKQAGFTQSGGNKKKKKAVVKRGGRK